MTHHTPAIMIQGTCSNAGKSLLVAALCRIFARDGLNPAPFKAQNMALNSFVTDDGREMGRAQALQAVACGRAPDARMNPVLLKPSSDTGSQVMLLGRPVGHMRVQEYLAFKPEAWRSVTEAYASLAQEADIMILEGAGSPAEINLKTHDIVNMAMARHARATVLLVTDIDRGGAFASLVGTLALLDEAEQGMVAGFILNKFRGDASLLAPAQKYVTQRTGIPFLGVVPWLHGLNLPEEDSVSFRLYGINTAHQGPSAQRQDILDVVLVDVPHISNINDVDPLRGEADVRLRLARTAADLEMPEGGSPDLIILPGSKNTPGDLRHLRKNGMAEALLTLAQRENAPLLLGICGGLQMLGQSVHDPLGLESGEPCTLQGLGLLPLHTELTAEKTLRRVEAYAVRSGHKVTGYEIHHGVTRTGGDGAHVLLADAQGRPLGWTLVNGLVWGTYLHGVLDDDAFRRHVLNGLRHRRGWASLSSGTPYRMAEGLDRLADAVQTSLNMDAVYKMVKIPVTC